MIHVAKMIQESPESRLFWISLSSESMKRSYGVILTYACCFKCALHRLYQSGIIPVQPNVPADIEIVGEVIDRLREIKSDPTEIAFVKDIKNHNKLWTVEEINKHVVVKTVNEWMEEERREGYVTPKTGITVEFTTNPQKLLQ